MTKDSPAADVPGADPEPPPAVAPLPQVAADWTAPDPGGSGPLDIPGVALPPPDYTAGGVPNLDFVRDKIEGRFARSLGSTELAGETPEAQSAAEQAAKREEAAREKLAAIRRSLHGDPPT